MTNKYYELYKSAFESQSKENGEYDLVYIRVGAEKDEKKIGFLENTNEKILCLRLNSDDLFLHLLAQKPNLLDQYTIEEEINNIATSADIDPSSLLLKVEEDENNIKIRIAQDYSYLLGNAENGFGLLNTFFTCTTSCMMPTKEPERNIESEGKNLIFMPEFLSGESHINGMKEFIEYLLAKDKCVIFEDSTSVLPSILEESTKLCRSIKNDNFLPIKHTKLNDNIYPIINGVSCIEGKSYEIADQECKSQTELKAKIQEFNLQENNFIKDQKEKLAEFIKKISEKGDREEKEDKIICDTNEKRLVILKDPQIFIETSHISNILSEEINYDKTFSAIIPYQKTNKNDIIITKIEVDLTKSEATLETFDLNNLNTAIGPDLLRNIQDFIASNFGIPKETIKIKDSPKTEIKPQLPEQKKENLKQL